MGRKYKNPPVVEAVCEFRFEHGAPWDMTIPGLLYEKLREDFPKRRTVLADPKIEATPETVRFTPVESSRFLSEDEKELVLVDPRRLAVSRLKPYTSWKEFLPLIERVFAAYWEAGEPRGIQRVGLRYINRFEFSSDRVELEHYLDFHPFVGRGLPQDHAAFIVGIEAQFDDWRDVLRLQLNSVGNKEGVALVLDLDYFLGKSDEINFTDEGVRGWLEVAHGRVEEAFEGCIKDKLRDTFEEVGG